MKYDREVQELVGRVGEVVTLSTLEKAGLPKHIIHLGIRAGWVRLLPAIWLTHAGPPTFNHWVEAALHYYGPNAAIGGKAAMFLHKLIDQPPAEIEVWIDPSRSVSKPKGSCITPRRDKGGRVQRALPGEGVVIPADAMCDYLDQLTDSNEAASRVIDFRKRMPWMVESTLELIAIRKRLKHREITKELLTCKPPYDSVLEYRWVKDIEEAHGIEPAERQWRGPQRFIWDGVWHRHKHTLELDGLAHHSDAKAIARDSAKDRAAIAAGYTPLHFVYKDVFHRACYTAMDLLNLIPGLEGAHGCRPTCPVSK